MLFYLKSMQVKNPDLAIFYDQIVRLKSKIRLKSVIHTGKCYSIYICTLAIKEEGGGGWYCMVCANLEHENNSILTVALTSSLLASCLIPYCSSF